MCARGPGRLPAAVVLAVVAAASGVALAAPSAPAVTAMDGVTTVAAGCGDATGLADGADRLFVAPDTSAVVFGENPALADETVSVTLRFGDGDVALERSTRVNDDGDWRVEFPDAALADRGLTFVAVLRHDGQVLDAVPGVVRRPTATVAFGNQTAARSPPPADETTVTVAAVSLEAGGFVTVHRGGQRGPIVGPQRLPLTRQPHRRRRPAVGAPGGADHADGDATLRHRLRRHLRLPHRGG